VTPRAATVVRPAGPGAPSRPVASAQAGHRTPTVLSPSRTEVLDYLAPAVRRTVERLSSDLWRRVEEIRLRRGRPLSLVTASGDLWLTPEGCPAADPGQAQVVSAEDTSRTLSLVCQGSVYALEEQLRHGFVTIAGGHRVGLAGRALVEEGHVRTITQVAGLNFRLSREVRGAALPVLPLVAGQGRRPRSVLVVSPPGCGKTTFLRDLVRLMSDGVPELGCPGYRVGLVDERSEVAACHEGVPQRDVGLRTDVLDSCPKAQGILLLLRAMSPEVIAVDEIGRPEDAAALHEAACAGAAVAATAHATSLEELSQRPMLRGLVSAGLFEVFVVLSRRLGPGTVEAVVEGGRPAEGGWAGGGWPTRGG